jgi:hypothetical protein
MRLSIDEVIDYLTEHWTYVKHPHKVKLAALLNLSYSPKQTEQSDFRVGEPVDMLTEVQEQMTMVRVIRSRIMSLGENADPKALQSLVSTTTSLFAMLTKYSSEMVNQDRIKKIEAAVVEAITTLPKEIQEKYFETLEKLLSE